MSAYEKQDVYRIVAADGGGVRVLMPGGLATTALEKVETAAEVGRANRRRRRSSPTPA